MAGSMQRLRLEDNTGAQSFVVRPGRFTGFLKKIAELK